MICWNFIHETKRKHLELSVSNTSGLYILEKICSLTLEVELPVNGNFQLQVKLAVIYGIFALKS